MRPRFQHILVPVDFTPKNQAALEIAFEQALHNESRVTLLHVIETIDTGDDESDDELKKFYERLQQRAWSELDSMAQRFAGTNIPVDQKVRLGRRPYEIVAFAGEQGVDLIVMSSHTVDPQQPIQSLSTVSYQVSVLCDCAVLLVK